jgi:hypothetical protein
MFHSCPAGSWKTAGLSLAGVHFRYAKNPKRSATCPEREGTPGPANAEAPAENGFWFKDVNHPDGIFLIDMSYGQKIEALDRIKRMSNSRKAQKGELMKVPAGPSLNSF